MKSWSQFVKEELQNIVEDDKRGIYHEVPAGILVALINLLLEKYPCKELFPVEWNWEDKSF